VPTLPFLLLLPATALGLLWLVVVRNRERLGLGSLSARGALLIAFLVFEAVVALLTQLSSVGHHFDTTSVVVVWVVVVLVLIGLAWPSVVESAKRVRSGAAGRQITALSLEERILLLTITGFFAVLSVVGWLYPPNNGDSLVYHLPRVVHWIQEGSVTHFATHYLAQIELSPLHEYNLAQLHLLAGGSDRLDGYVQLAAMAVFVIGVSEVARLLGASRRGQWTAAALAVTIPTGILEATSTQNNDFAGAIAIAILAVLLAWRPGPGWTVKAGAVGLGAGLAALTKGTLPALIGPAAVVLAVVVIRREVTVRSPAQTARRTLAVAGIAGVSALAVCFPFFYGNVQAFGSLTGPVSRSTIDSQFDVRAGLGNVIRSTAADFWIGNGRSGFETTVSKAALETGQGLYDQLGVSQNDVRFALGTNTRAFKVQDYERLTRAEDYGANPWHVVLIVLTGTALAGWVLAGDRSLRVALLLALGLAGGYLLFTMTARWSAFNVRYQLPLLAAWCPLIAIVLDRLWRVIGIVVLAGLVVASLPALLDNFRRSLLHPQYHFTSTLQPYFLDAGKLGRAGGHGVRSVEYGAVTQAIAQSGCQRVGLANWILVEYPIWAGLRLADWHGTIEQVGVTNESARYEVVGFNPCAVIRQETPTYVAPDDGRAHLQFGKLALAIDGRDARHVRVRQPRFSSAVPGVSLLPGGGWSLARSNATVRLVHGGSLVLSSAAPRRVRLRLVAAPGADPSTLRVEGPGVGAATDTGSVRTVDVAVPRGQVRVRLHVTAGPGDATVPLTGVEVLATPSS
jgi:hypothetical protein